MYLVLRRGAASRSVDFLQNRLLAHGFQPGWADGRFGPLTELAVRQFQASMGLRVDGIVGDLTWAALARSAEVARPSAVLEDARNWLLQHLDGVVAPPLPVLVAAIGTLGWMEAPLGSNDGPEVGRISRGYYSPEDEKRYGLPPWCALAVCYWMKEGLQVPRYADTPLGARLGGVSQIERWATARGRFTVSRVKIPVAPGSIFTMARLGSGSDPVASTRAGHCGLVVADEGAWVVTIEGNSGNAVQSRRRRKSSFRGWIEWW